MKVTLEQLIKKKLDKDNKRNATKEIYVESLGGEITFTNPTDSARLEWQEKAKTGSLIDGTEASVKLIYDCCPMLHSKELQESCSIDYPYDIVKAVFDVEDIMKIAPDLLDFFDKKKIDTDKENDKPEDKLKN